MRTLVLLWHPTSMGGVIAAGGFKRTYETFKRYQGEGEVRLIDAAPSFFRDLKDRPGFQLYEYTIPSPIKFWEDKFFVLERVCEWIWSFFSLLSIGFRIVKQTKPQVIYVPSSELLHLTGAGFLLSKLTKLPLVLVNMNIAAPTLLLKMMHWLNVRLHNRADRVIAISDSLRNELTRAGVSAPILVNKVGLDTRLVKDTPDQPKLYGGIYVARHVKEKGVFDVIEIWKKVVEDDHSAKLLMIGQADTQTRGEIQRLIQSLGLQEGIIIKGVVDEEEKFVLYKQSKVCLFPSYAEGWGIVPQEALISGIPVVVYDLPVYQENISGCPAVEFVEVGDKGAFARQVLKYLKLPAAERENFGEIGQDWVKKFDWEQIAKREWSILQDLV